MGILIYMDTDLCTHVALVGLMGAGKTVIGASLARKSNVRHVDLDRWIQNRYGRSIGVIFNERGEKGEDENRSILKENSHVIWLKATPEGLAKRVGEGRGRPLLKDKDPLEVLQLLNAEREENYKEVADLVIDVESGTVEEISDHILALTISKGNK